MTELPEATSCQKRLNKSEHGVNVHRAQGTGASCLQGTPAFVQRIPTNSLRVRRGHSEQSFTIRNMFSSARPLPYRSLPNIHIQQNPLPYSKNLQDSSLRPYLDVKFAGQPNQYA